MIPQTSMLVWQTAYEKEPLTQNHEAQVKYCAEIQQVAHDEIQRPDYVAGVAVSLFGVLSLFFMYKVFTLK